MSNGMGNVQFNGINGSSPAAVLGANNGLSVNGLSSFVVLGQDVGEAGDPAVLLSAREIPINAFAVRFRTNAAGQYLRIGQFPTNASFAGFGCESNSAAGRAGIFYINDAAAASALNPLWFMTVSAGEFQLNDSTGLFLRLTRLATAGTFGSLSAKLHMYHPVQDFAVSTVISNTVHRPRTVMTNRGAAGVITFTLPNFNAAVTFADYTFTIVAAFGIIIQAPGGVTIRIGAVVSPAGGTVSAAAVGDSVRLMQLNATEWQAVAMVGAWATP